MRERLLDGLSTALIGKVEQQPRDTPRYVEEDEPAENDLAPVFTDEHDFDTARPDDEQRVAGIVLEEDDATLRIELLTGDVGKALQLDAIESTEELDGRQEVDGLRRDGSGHEAP